MRFASGVALSVLLAVSVVARADLYEFKVEGVMAVVQGAPGDISVGDPFSILYTADSQDIFPESGTYGQYRASTAKLTFANAFLDSPGFNPSVQVSLGPTNFPRVQYLDSEAHTFNLRVEFYVPLTALDSDALPLELDLAQADRLQFRYFGNFDFYLRGTIESYTSRRVPEPATAALVVAMALLRRRRAKAEA